MDLNKKQKGVSLLFVIIIMGVVLAIGAGLSTIFIQEGQMMMEIGYSVIAFYAADAGIERVLMMDATPTVTEDLDTDVPGASYTVSTRCGKGVLIEACPPPLATSSSCDALNYCMKSIGSYKTVKRAIEIEY